MQKFYATIALLAFVLTPSFSFAFTQGYLGDGFGSDEVNDYFCDTGLTDNGVPYYKKLDDSLTIWGDNGQRYWKINTDINDVGVHLYDGDTGGAGQTLSVDPDGAVTWTTADGDSPVGSFTSVDCDEIEEDPPTGDTATSTIDWGSATTTNRMLGSLNFGVTILITLFLIFFCGYLWNSMHKKKPWQ